MARAEMVAGVRRGEGGVGSGEWVGGGRLVEEGGGGGVGEEVDEVEVEVEVEVDVEDAEDDEVVEELEDDSAEETTLCAV